MRTVYPVGTTLFKPGQCCSGYTIIFGGLEVKLVDMNGRPVHTWCLDTELHEHGTGRAHLLDNGHVLTSRGGMTSTDGVIDEYDWETAIDTRSTWRIGDGTASFYNYIYFTVAGFSEVDTFRSNQVREGLITREEALKLSYEENFPRYENLKWYTTIIGIPYRHAIQRINRIPKLYQNQ